MWLAGLINLELCTCRFMVLSQATLMGSMPPYRGSSSSSGGGGTRASHTSSLHPSDNLGEWRSAGGHPLRHDSPRQQHGRDSTDRSPAHKSASWRLPGDWR